MSFVIVAEQQKDRITAITNILFRKKVVIPFSKYDFESQFMTKDMLTACVPGVSTYQRHHREGLPAGIVKDEEKGPSDRHSLRTGADYSQFG